MNLEFYKYHGAGNDFILLDNRECLFTSIEKSPEIIRKLCDRHFGIGADGLMLLNSSVENDFSMVYFNSDGNEGTMCGNGGRCIVLFAKHLKIINHKTTFEAIDGLHEASILEIGDEEAIVKLKMQDVDGIQFKDGFYNLNTGSPHYVKFVQDLKSMNVYKEGKEIRYSEPFKIEGINVNFVEIEDNRLFVRTYERGVENETLACGTGVTASVLAYVVDNKISDTEIYIRTLGGNLTVSFERKGDSRFQNIWLQGPAAKVFIGNITI